MKPIVFLHLPKTAGQSVRQFLCDAFPRRSMFPGQMDQHLALFSRADLRQYDMFAGHFSWSLLDVLGEDALLLTVLRDPVERILSFFRFLRRQGLALSEAQKNDPNMLGLAKAAELSFEEYIDNPDPTIRSFVLSYFDNYYLYYFATRLANGRGLIRDHYPEENYFVTEQALQVALRNLHERVRVFRMTDLAQLAEALSGEYGYAGAALPRLNAAPASQPNDLTGISQNIARAQELLHLRCQFDARIYNAFG